MNIETKLNTDEFNKVIKPTLTKCQTPNDR